MSTRNIVLRDNRTLLKSNETVYTEFMVIFFEMCSKFKVKQIGVEDASVY
jgi:hypothetical protein